MVSEGGNPEGRTGGVPLPGVTVLRKGLPEVKVRACPEPVEGMGELITGGKRD